MHMAEVIQKLETELRGSDGRRYTAQVSGRERPDALWEGWIEFLPMDGGKPLVTSRETTQPNRDDLIYWASGLTDPYLDGALMRVLTPVKEKVHSEPGEPVQSMPEPHRVPGARSSPPPTAVLDPFHVYAEGDDVLRDQLHALAATQLRNMVRAYAITDLEPHDLERLSESELIDLIMGAVARDAAK
jgi:hypothetical protein